MQDQTMNTYQPTGTGHCKRCGRDVGTHDPGHLFVDCECSHCTRFHARGLTGYCERCHLGATNPIHDKGRTLRCPS